jgi:hypothetical protein
MLQEGLLYYRCETLHSVYTQNLNQTQCYLRRQSHANRHDNISKSIRKKHHRPVRLSSIYLPTPHPDPARARLTITQTGTMVNHSPTHPSIHLSDSLPA